MALESMALILFSCLVTFPKVLPLSVVEAAEEVRSLVVALVEATLINTQQLHLQHNTQLHTSRVTEILVEEVTTDLPVVQTGAAVVAVALALLAVPQSPPAQLRQEMVAQALDSI
jgi:hypothetical protein